MMKKYICPTSYFVSLGAENALMLTGSLITDPSETIGGGNAMTPKQETDEEEWNNFWAD